MLLCSSSLELQYTVVFERILFQQSERKPIVFILCCSFISLPIQNICKSIATFAKKNYEPQSSHSFIGSLCTIGCLIRPCQTMIGDILSHNIKSLRGNVKKNPSMHKDIIQIEVDPSPSHPILTNLFFDKVLIPPSLR